MGNFQTGLGNHKPDLSKGFQFASNTGMEYWRNRPETIAKLGPLKTSVMRYNINIFPNLFIIDRLFIVRHPVAPSEMEQRFTALYDASTPEHVQAEELRTTYRRLGPTGFLEQEDGENFIESTRGLPTRPSWIATSTTRWHRRARNRRRRTEPAAHHHDAQRTRSAMVLPQLGRGGVGTPVAATHPEAKVEAVR